MEIPYENSTITVEEFLLLYKRREDGQDINSHNVKRLKAMVTPEQFLFGVKATTIKLDSHGEKILAGNHRHKALEELYEEGLLDKKFLSRKLHVKLVTKPLTKQEEADIAYSDNFSQTAATKRSHIIKPKTPFNEKILHPILAALKEIDSVKSTTKHSVEVLSKNLALWINKNSEDFAKLTKTGVVETIYGTDIYEARSFSENKTAENYYNISPSISLNTPSMKRAVKEKLELAFDMLRYIQDNVAMRGKQNPMSLIYIIVAAAFRGEISQNQARDSGKITKKKIKDVLVGEKTPAAREKAFNALQNHASEGRNSENIILDYFSGKV